MRFLSHIQDRWSWRGVARSGVLAQTSLYRPDTEYAPEMPPPRHAFREPRSEYVEPGPRPEPEQIRRGSSIVEFFFANKEPTKGMHAAASIADKLTRIARRTAVLALTWLMVMAASDVHAQLTPNGFELPSPLTGNEIVDCQLPASPYITTCTTGQIGALGGSGSGDRGVNGVAALRQVAAVNNQTVLLNYHTTPGDLGLGNFIGTTGHSPGTYVDNNGTIIVPSGGNGSAAWLRVWDGQNADMGWWGAKFDHIADDYTAWTQAIGLFSFGGTCSTAFATKNGTLNIHGGFNHSKPLVYAGCVSAGVTTTGTFGSSLGQGTASYLNYTGPTTSDQIILIGANGTYFQNVDLLQNNASNGVHFLSDGAYGTTTTTGAAPGTSVTIGVASTTNMAAGTQLGLGYGLSTFEVVTVTSVGAGSIVVQRVLNSHNSAEQIGGGGPGNNITVDNVFSTVPNILTAPTGTAFVIGNVTSGSTNEVADVTINHSGCTGNLGATSFTGSISATTMTVSGVAGTPLAANMYVLDAGYGSQAALVQRPTTISSGSGSTWTVSPSQSVSSEAMVALAPAHACIRQTDVGNTKNMKVNYFIYTFVEIAADLPSSGFVDIYEMQGSEVFDTIFHFGTANFNVYNFEDESHLGMMLRATCGANPGVINFFSGSWQSSPPTTGSNANLAVNSTCITNLYGAQFFNVTPSGGIGYATPAGLDVQPLGTNNNTAFASIGSWFQYAQPGTENIFSTGNATTIWYGLGSSTPVEADKNLKIVFLNNLGGTAGAMVNLDNILPNARNQEQSVYSGSGQGGGGTNTAVFNKSISGASNWASASLPFGKWTDNSATINWDLFALPPKTKVTAVYLDVTAGFTGVATCAMQAGSTSGALDLIKNASVVSPTGATPLGSQSADLGTLLASPVQGGWLSWASTGHIWVQLGCGAAIGTGSASHLSTGNVDVYVQTQRMTAP